MYVCVADVRQHKYTQSLRSDTVFWCYSRDETKQKKRENGLAYFVVDKRVAVGVFQVVREALLYLVHAELHQISPDKFEP